MNSERKQELLSKLAFENTKLHTGITKTGSGVNLDIRRTMHWERFWEWKVLNLAIAGTIGVIFGLGLFFILAADLALPRSIAPLFPLVMTGIAFYLLTRRHRPGKISLEVSNGRCRGQKSSQTFFPDDCRIEMDERFQEATFYLEEEIIKAEYLGRADFDKLEEYAKQTGLKVERTRFGEGDA